MLFPNIRMGGEFSEFEGLLEAKSRHTRTFKAGELVHGPNEVRQQVNYYIKRGLVNTTLLHVNGGYAELNLRGAGSIVPMYYSVDSTSMGVVQEAIAEQDCEVLCIPKQAIRKLILESPEFAMAMIDSYAKFATYLNYNLLSRLYDTLPTRVANFFVMHSVGQNVSATQSDIARAVGGSRSKVSQALTELKEAGIIETYRGHIDIIDFDRLIKLCTFTMRW